MTVIKELLLVSGLNYHHNSASTNILAYAICIYVYCKNAKKAHFRCKPNMLYTFGIITALTLSDRTRIV